MVHLDIIKQGILIILVFQTAIKGKRVYISAIKNIKKGTELSYDYGKEYFDEYIKSKCSCPKCK